MLDITHVIKTYELCFKCSYNNQYVGNNFELKQKCIEHNLLFTINKNYYIDIMKKYENLVKKYKLEVVKTLKI